MKKIKFYKLILIGIFAGILATSCDTQEVFPDPEIQFLSEDGYVFSDTVLALNENFKIGLQMESRSDEKLLHLNTTINRDGKLSSIDTALYTMSFDHITGGTKSLAQEEMWSFYCRDRDGRKSELIKISIRLDEGSQFGQIRVLDSIWLGAQRNSEFGHFFSFDDAKVYSTDEGYEASEKINLAFFYDEASGDMSTIASPGANIDPSFFPGEKGPANWEVKNTTRFIPLPGLSRDEFEASENDSLLLANTFDFPAGKRKAKLLSNDKVHAFVTESGMSGLFIVNELVGEDDGFINITIKMKAK